jgi:hypothetical protein
VRSHAFGPKNWGQVMSDLDPRAKAIIDAGREADVPAAADRARIKRAVLAQIAAGAAVASTTAAAAGTLSLGAKVGVAVLVLSVAGGGTFGVLRVRDLHRAKEAAVQVSPRPAPAPASDPASLAGAGEQALVPEQTAAPAVRAGSERRPERSRRPHAPSVRIEKGQEEDPLNAEVEVLKRAREELRLHRPARALDALTEYDRRFGEGALGQERHAMAAIAACQAFPGAASRAQAEAFMRKAPLSPLRERVREACITPSAVIPR